MFSMIGKKTDRLNRIVRVALCVAGLLLCLPIFKGLCNIVCFCIEFPNIKVIRVTYFLLILTSVGFLYFLFSIYKNSSSTIPNFAIYMLFALIIMFTDDWNLSAVVFVIQLCCCVILFILGILNRSSIKWLLILIPIIVPSVMIARFPVSYPYGRTLYRFEVEDLFELSFIRRKLQSSFEKESVLLPDFEDTDKYKYLPFSELFLNSAIRIQYNDNNVSAFSSLRRSALFFYDIINVEESDNYYVLQCDLERWAKYKSGTYFTILFGNQPKDSIRQYKLIEIKVLVSEYNRWRKERLQRIEGRNKEEKDLGAFYTKHDNRLEYYDGQSNICYLIIKIK